MQVQPNCCPSALYHYVRSRKVKCEKAGDLGDAVQVTLWGHLTLSQKAVKANMQCYGCIAELPVISQSSSHC